MKVSVVINTWNEEKNIKRCLESVRHLADEIVVIDMHSTDKTAEVARKYGAKVFSHKHVGYVEPARNYGLRCAQGKYIFILDADEEAPPVLIKKLKEIAETDEVDFVRIPRKNIIFGKWIKHSRWWPDYNIRFFKKGKVTWSDKIHSIPLTKGRGEDLKPTEVNAIIHHHYQSISQYLARLNRYTDIQAKELVGSGYKFAWQDILQKPTGEFLSRFFAGEGYKDGLYGLVLALLQAFSELIKYLKVWESQGFKAEEFLFSDFVSEMKRVSKGVTYWIKASLIKETGNTRKKFFLKIKSKLF